MTETEIQTVEHNKSENSRIVYLSFVDNARPSFSDFHVIRSRS